MASFKRSHSPTPEQHEIKRTRKLHPFFSITEQRKTKNASIWQPSINRTCKHAVHSCPPESVKVAAFDLDGTIIAAKDGKRFAASATDWNWWRKEVPITLERLSTEGFAIVIFTNQNLGEARLNAWYQKVELVAEQLPNVPFRLLAATAQDVYRKPMPGMWLALENLFREKGVTIERKHSFFVGDAAGRRGDHSASDRKFAMNLGLPFHTPEAFFLGLPESSYQLPGFSPTKLLEAAQQHTVPAVLPALRDDLKPEVVVLVGCPGLGKTTFYQDFFAPLGYVHVNQDQLKRRDKCLQVVSQSLDMLKSCVVDNTNRDIATRRLYIDIARKYKCRIRCFVLTGSAELAWHNILYRSWTASHSTTAANLPRELVPRPVLEKFFKEYESPTLEEGFEEINQIPWVFRGSKEDETHWRMWLE